MLLKAGATFKGGRIPMSGAVLDRHNGLRIPIIETGRGVNFAPVIVPGPWLSTMLTLLDAEAKKEGYSPNDYTLICPIELKGSQFYVTNDILQNSGPDDIRLVRKVIVHETVEQLPIVDSKGNISTMPQLTITIRTFNEEVMFLSLDKDTVLLGFDIPAHIEAQYAGITARTFIQESKERTVTSDVKIGSRLIFPKARTDSNLNRDIFNLLYEKFNINPTKKAAW